MRNQNSKVRTAKRKLSKMRGRVQNILRFTILDIIGYSKFSLGL